MLQSSYRKTISILQFSRLFLESSRPRCDLLLSTARRVFYRTCASSRERVYRWQSFMQLHLAKPCLGERSRGPLARHWRADTRRPYIIDWICILNIAWSTGMSCRTEEEVTRTNVAVWDEHEGGKRNKQCEKYMRAYREEIGPYQRWMSKPRIQECGFKCTVILDRTKTTERRVGKKEKKDLHQSLHTHVTDQPLKIVQLGRSSLPILVRTEGKNCFGVVRDGVSFLLQKKKEKEKESV